MKASAIILNAQEVRDVLAGKTAHSTPVTAKNSLVNGWSPGTREGDISAWSVLRFDEAWIDNGPSPAGNAGPYLKVPGADESVHRVYPKHWVDTTFWVREDFAVLTGNGLRVVYRATDGEALPFQPGTKVPMTWTHASRMSRLWSRIELKVTGVSVEKRDGWHWVYGWRLIRSERVAA